MQRTRIWLKSLLVIGGLAVTAPAHAGLLSVDVSQSAGSGTYAGSTRWGYTVSLDSHQQLNDGDYFTIYDVNGLVSGSAMAPADKAGWAASVQNTGITPGHVVPNDDATKPNVTFTYHGATVAGDSDVPIGEFVFYSTNGDTMMGSFNFASNVHNVNPDGSVVEVTNTSVPVPGTGPGGGTPPTETPEPATLLLFGAAVPFLGGLKAFRRKK